jgi:hypothetical protein
MMFESVINSYRKLRENDAFSVLLRPGVVSNYLAFQREIAAMPVIMTSTPPGMEIELAVDPARLHFFDPASGAVLGRAVRAPAAV